MLVPKCDRCGRVDTKNFRNSTWAGEIMIHIDFPDRKEKNHFDHLDCHLCDSCFEEYLQTIKNYTSSYFS